MVVRVTPKEAALITIKGDQCREKAKALAKEMREILGKKGTVSCPRRMAEVEVAGFDPSTTTSELRDAIVSTRVFLREDLSLGTIRRTKGTRPSRRGGFPDGQGGPNRMDAGAGVQARRSACTVSPLLGVQPHWGLM